MPKFTVSVNWIPWFCDFGITLMTTCGSVRCVVSFCAARAIARSKSVALHIRRPTCRSAVTIWWRPVLTSSRVAASMTHVAISILRTISSRVCLWELMRYVHCRTLVVSFEENYSRYFNEDFLSLTDIALIIIDLRFLPMLSSFSTFTALTLLVRHGVLIPCL